MHLHYTADIIQYCDLVRCQVIYNTVKFIYNNDKLPYRPTISLKDIDSCMNRAIDRRLLSRIILKQCFLTI